MKKDEDIIQEALERYTIASECDMEERGLALDDLKFEHNEDNYQWPADIRTQRERSKSPRPCLSLNKIPEKINEVEGEFKQMRPSFKIRGVDSASDPKVANIIGGIIRQIEYGSNAKSAYNHSHSQSLKCGRGGWRIDIEDSPADPFVKDIVINRIANVLAIIIDPDSQKQDRSDANYMFLVSEMSIKEFESKYPDADPVEWPVDAKTEKTGWRTDTTIRVVEYWWKEDETRTFYRVERLINGIPIQLTVKQDKLLGSDTIVEQKEAEVKVVRWAKLTFNQILDGPTEWPSRYIPIIFEVGRETNIDGQNKMKGMVRDAKTPQQMYNFWSSSITEQIALSPKAPYLVTPAMLKGFQNMWDQSNIENFLYLFYNPDPKMPQGYPKREPPPLLSPAIGHELQRMAHDIMSAMGIYQASLGAQGPEVSGKAILAKQKQGSLGSYTFTDNFQIALVYSMKVIIDLIPYVYDTERIIRIRGEDGSEKSVPINARPVSPMLKQQEFSPDLISDAREGVTEYINDMTVGAYDVVVSIGPSYDTQRQEALAVLMELVGNIPQFGPATVDLIVQNIDVPGVADELVKRAKKIVPVDIRGLEPGEQPPPPPQPTPEEQIELKKLQLEGLKEMREGFEAKVDAIAKLMTAEAKEQGQQLQAITAFVEELRNAETMKQQQERPAGEAQQ